MYPESLYVSSWCFLTLNPNFPFLIFWAQGSLLGVPKVKKIFSIEPNWPKSPQKHPLIYDKTEICMFFLQSAKIMIKNFFNSGKNYQIFKELKNSLVGIKSYWEWFLTKNKLKKFDFGNSLKFIVCYFLS